jgi:hypothetical protein
MDPVNLKLNKTGPFPQEQQGEVVKVMVNTEHPLQHHLFKYIITFTILISL